MSLDTATAVALRDKTMVLATDLDGTFLGGPEPARRALYDWIEDNRETVGLVFVTGRDPAFIMELCETTAVPFPEYAVGDVGTTIAEVCPTAGVTPIAELETTIADAWKDSGKKVVQALDGWPGLMLQPTPFRYRVSYDLNPAAFDEGAKQIVTDMGLDWLISDNRYFDVLPKGISKGPSLKRFLAHLQVSPGRVLAAGDTLNDLSLLSAGLPSVAVGNAEAALRAELGDRPGLHHAAGHGAAGIAEAIMAFDLHPLGALINAK